MTPKFYNLDSLKEELKQLPHLHRVAFVASICERMLPIYNTFSQTENWGKPSVPRTALNEIWLILQGKPSTSSKIHQLREDCGCDDVCPDSDSDNFGNSCYLYEAQETLFALRAALRAYLEPNLEDILQVVEYARFEIVEIFISTRDKSFNLKQNQDKFEAIANHPLAQQELAKEMEDLQRLKNADKLDPELLEWLRTTSCNNGKSLIDLSST